MKTKKGFYFNPNGIFSRNCLEKSNWQPFNLVSAKKFHNLYLVVHQIELKAKEVYGLKKG